MTGKAALAFALMLLITGCASSPDPESNGAAGPKRPEPTPTSERPGGAAPPTESSEGSESASAEEGTENDPASDQEEAKEKDGPGRVVLDTVYDDRRVGEDQTHVIESELGLVEDEALNRYVRSVAIRLLRHAPSRPFNYEFKIVDQSVPNAFALPGGKIYVSRGLLTLVTNEDELAGVLGHEITHAAERHASARMEYNRRINPLAIGLLRAARIAAYGRDQERDADRGGQILAARAGYDPEGIARFLRKLDASERYVVGWSRLPSFLATHPTSPERSALASNRATTLTWKRVPGVAGSSPGSYYEMIDGLIIGDDPAGGLFDDENRFIHPDLRFSIRFPQGWTTMNTQKAVRALSPARDAQATLTVLGGGETDLAKAVDDFVDSEFDGLRIHVRDRRTIKIGELAAIRIEGRASAGLAGLEAQMTFVRYGDLVYRLTVLSPSSSRTKYRGRSRTFAHSFRPLDDEGVHSLKVTRLRTAWALDNETLQALSSRTRNELEVVFTGVLNGLYASTPLDHRTPIKIGIAEPYLPKREVEASKSSGNEDASENDVEMTTRSEGDD